MKIHFKNLQKGQSIQLLIVDLIMLSLIFLNLLWMTFDFSFETRIFQNLINNISEDFFNFYSITVHPDFLLYDSFFVAIFLIEIVIRWVVAIIKKEYNNWLAYPFVHWYDVLGCIPVGGFRSLRLLRIISIIIRLQKKKIIDVRKTWWYKLLNKYYNILVEEVSDRVVVNVIKGTQKEIEAGSEISDRLIEEVIKPRQAIIVKWVTQQIDLASTHFFKKNSSKLKLYINNSVKEALINNKDIRKLNAVPVLGPKVTAAVSSSISDVTYHVIEKMISDLSAEENEEIIDELINTGLIVAQKTKGNDQYSVVAKEILIDALELVKEQVKIKQWKENN